MDEASELLSAARDDEAAFTAFVAARWNQLLRTAYLLTGDHGKAEDMVQTALMRTHRRWRRIERDDAPEVYVRRVMVNLATAWWRRNRIQEQVTAELPDRPGPDAHAAFVLHDEIWNAVRTLPARMRAVLVLRYFEDLPEAQVADLLGCSVGTVKSQTHRALARLRAQLSDDDAGTGAAPDPEEAPAARRPLRVPRQAAEAPQTSQNRPPLLGATGDTPARLPRGRFASTARPATRREAHVPPSGRPPAPEAESVFDS